MSGAVRAVTIAFPDKDRQVRFDHNALADLEEYAGQGVAELFKKEMNFAAIRMMVKFGLQWKERGITLPVAGNYVQAYVDAGGSLDDLFQKLLEAARASGLFKQFDVVSDEDAAARPPTADAT